MVYGVMIQTLESAWRSGLRFRNNRGKTVYYLAWLYYQTRDQTSSTRLPPPNISVKCTAKQGRRGSHWAGQWAAKVAASASAITGDFLRLSVKN